MNWASKFIGIVAATSALPETSYYSFGSELEKIADLYLMEKVGMNVRQAKKIVGIFTKGLEGSRAGMGGGRYSQTQVRKAHKTLKLELPKGWKEGAKTPAWTRGQGLPSARDKALRGSDREIVAQLSAIESQIGKMQPGEIRNAIGEVMSRSGLPAREFGTLMRRTTPKLRTWSRTTGRSIERQMGVRPDQRISPKTLSREGAAPKDVRTLEERGEALLGGGSGAAKLKPGAKSVLESTKTRPKVRLPEGSTHRMIGEKGDPALGTLTAGPDPARLKSLPQTQEQMKIFHEAVGGQAKYNNLIKDIALGGSKAERATDQLFQVIKRRSVKGGKSLIDVRRRVISDVGGAVEQRGISTGMSTQEAAALRKQMSANMSGPDKAKGSMIENLVQRRLRDHGISTALVPKSGPRGPIQPAPVQGDIVYGKTKPELARAAAARLRGKEPSMTARDRSPTRRLRTQAEKEHFKRTGQWPKEAPASAAKIELPSPHVEATRGTVTGAGLGASIAPRRVRQVGRDTTRREQQGLTSRGKNIGRRDPRKRLDTGDPRYVYQHQTPYGVRTNPGQKKQIEELYAAEKAKRIEKATAKRKKDRHAASQAEKAKTSPRARLEAGTLSASGRPQVSVKGTERKLPEVRLPETPAYVRRGTEQMHLQQRLGGTPLKKDLGKPPSEHTPPPASTADLKATQLKQQGIDPKASIRQRKIKGLNENVTTAQRNYDNAVKNTIPKGQPGAKESRRNIQKAYDSLNQAKKMRKVQVASAEQSQGQLTKNLKTPSKLRGRDAENYREMLGKEPVGRLKGMSKGERVGHRRKVTDQQNLKAAVKRNKKLLAERTTLNKQIETYRGVDEKQFAPQIAQMEKRLQQIRAVNPEKTLEVSQRRLTAMGTVEAGGKSTAESAATLKGHKATVEKNKSLLQQRKQEFTAAVESGDQKAIATAKENFNLANTNLQRAQGGAQSRAATLKQQEQLSALGAGTPAQQTQGVQRLREPTVTSRMPLPQDPRTQGVLRDARGNVRQQAQQTLEPRLKPVDTVPPVEPPPVQGGRPEGGFTPLLEPTPPAQPPGFWQEAKGVWNQMPGWQKGVVGGGAAIGGFNLMGGFGGQRRQGQQAPNMNVNFKHTFQQQQQQPPTYRHPQNPYQPRRGF